MCVCTMALLCDLGCEDFIRNRVKSGATHQEIAAELRGLYPGLPGLSGRSLRRFCFLKQIHRSSRLSSQSVDEVVEQAIAQVRCWWFQI